MPNNRLLSLLRVVLAMACIAASANRAAAGPILLSDVHVEVDPVGLFATITARLEAESEAFLDALSVDLSQDGQAIADLFAGPTLLDVQPFFNLPYLLSPGDVLQSGTVLFQITGLVANASYAGSFALFQFDPDGSATTLASEAFSFSTAPVPEPASLLLLATGLGATGLLGRRRRRQARS